MEIVILDAKTLGDDMEFSMFERLGSVSVHQTTSPTEIADRISDAEVIIVNKIKLGEHNLDNAKKLKLICVTATGYDNIDLDYCRQRGIAVCNVKGYSTESVAQVTMSMALSLVNHLNDFDSYVKSGRYTEGGVQNHLKPYFNEMSSLTWGIVGLGNIGKRVADIARAFGMKVVALSHSVQEDYECVSLDELCAVSDIISVHVPLTDETCGMISRDVIDKMKDGAVFINVSRGAVADEEALAEAVMNGKIGGLGIDVYTVEPIAADSPYNKILDQNNVILTPHMAWGAYQARVRCMNEIVKNIESFEIGEMRNRVD